MQIENGAYGPVAQSVEQGTFNSKAASSNLAGIANFNWLTDRSDERQSQAGAFLSRHQFNGSLAQWVEREILNLEVVGSSPT